MSQFELQFKKEISQPGFASGSLAELNIVPEQAVPCIS